MTTEQFMNVLAISRDAAIVFLVLQFMLIGAVPILVLLKTTQGLRWVLRRTVPGMRKAQAKTRQISAVIEEILGRIRAPFEWGHRMAAKARSAISSLQSRFDRGGVL